MRLLGHTQGEPSHFLFFYFFHSSHFHFPASGQAVVTGVVPSSPAALAFNFFLSRIGFINPIARRFFHRVLPTHALALSAGQSAHKKKSPRNYTSRMHSGGFELTKLTYTRLEDNLIRNRGDHYILIYSNTAFYKR